MKTTIGEVLTALAIVVSVAIVLTVFWLLVGPVLQLDGARWIP